MDFGAVKGANFYSLVRCSSVFFVCLFVESNSLYDDHVDRGDINRPYADISSVNEGVLRAVLKHVAS